MNAPAEGDTAPEPRTEFGGTALEFDWPSFRVGVAEYEEGPTGCTVFHFPEGAPTAIDVRGGLVGKTGDYELDHAICLAGGSLPGRGRRRGDRRAVGPGRALLGEPAARLGRDRLRLR